MLYVLSGSGALSLGGDEAKISPGAAAYVARGNAWHVAGADELVLLSVLVRDPLPSDGRTLDGARQCRRYADRNRRTRFQLLATPAVGCATVTQFVGYIPVGRAPDHFHTYDEVVYVLEGEGALHIDGESAELRAGSCVHLPAGIVHCLENVGPGEMRVLGVFRPAGSPAEAYYPDGTRAEY